MLQNPFDKDLLRKCFDTISCFDCGKNNPVDWHHILGRAGHDVEQGYLHSSILNAAPLCRDCHTPEKRTLNKKLPLSSEETEVKLLSLTLNHLRSQRYLLSAKDHAFQRKHLRYYSLIDQRQSALHQSRSRSEIRGDANQ